MDKPMTNIATDTLSFRSSFEYFQREVDRRYKLIENEFTSRYQNLEDRIRTTDDADLLRRLNSHQKFLKAVAEIIDFQRENIAYFSRIFHSLDESYWQSVTGFEALRKENEFLKGALANMTRQRDIAMSAWKSEKSKLRAV